MEKYSPTKKKLKYSLIFELKDLIRGQTLEELEEIQEKGFFTDLDFKGIKKKNYESYEIKIDLKLK